MVNFIVAIDERRGMADDHGIPWQGKLPTDVQFFRKMTQNGVVLMGYRTYEEFKEPLSDRKNLVVVREDTDPLRAGFEPVTNPTAFLASANDDIWVIGGAGLFAQTINLADRLYITHLQGDFHCTKFFPAFENEFELVQKSDTHVENGITFYFAQYKPKDS